MYKVLSLTGGGFFGLYTATVLAELEAKAGRPLNQIFDCISGTSIGGIIAMMLGSDIPAKEIVEIIQREGPVIFSDHWMGRCFKPLLHAMPPVFGTRYGNANLHTSLSSVFGEQTPFDQMKTTIMIPSYNVTRSKPHLFQTSGHKGKSANMNLTKVNVAMCTAAAPPWFPLHELNHQLYMDPAGYACAPDLLVFESLQHDLKIPMSKIHMLSIGSVTAHPTLFKPKDIKPGMLSWYHSQRLLLTQLAAQQQVTIDIMKRTLQHHYIRIDNVSSYEKQKILGIDRVDQNAQKILRKLGQDSFTKIAHNVALNRLLR